MEFEKSLKEKKMDDSEFLELAKRKYELEVLYAQKDLEAKPIKDEIWEIDKKLYEATKALKDKG